MFLRLRLMVRFISTRFLSQYKSSELFSDLQHLPFDFHRRINYSREANKTTNPLKMVSIRFALAIVFVVAVLAFTVEAGYRKPPFNGSIFGKRSNTESDAEVANRALSAMCEIASEACNAWLSR